MDHLHDDQGLHDLSFCVYGKDGVGWCVVYMILVVLSIIHVLLSLQKGWTPLTWASSAGHVECVQLLLDRGAHVNHQEDVSVYVV